MWYFHLELLIRFETYLFKHILLHDFLKLNIDSKPVIHVPNLTSKCRFSHLLCCYINSKFKQPQYHWSFIICKFVTHNGTELGLSYWIPMHHERFHKAHTINMENSEMLLQKFFCLHFRWHISLQNTIAPMKADKFNSEIYLFFYIYNRILDVQQHN